MNRLTNVDVEEQIDEEQAHDAAFFAIPRSDGVALEGLESLGLTAADKVDVVVRDADREESEDDSTENYLTPSQLSQANQSFSGTNWFVAPFKSRSRLLQHERNLLQTIMRSTHCHIELDPKRYQALIFAPSASFKNRAMKALSEASDRIVRPAQLPETCLDEGDPRAIEIAIDRLRTQRGYSHIVVRPDFIKRSTAGSPPLNAYRFRHPLDPVQTCAIECAARIESVMLCAPTSAGKTAVAEYAIAMALRARKRLIYTAPIKALSNQKYLELGEKFGSDRIGLLTGDVVIAVDAPVVIMTLEILQGMLFNQQRQPDLLDDFMFVVVDEAHYLGNEGRGFAWEEVLILLPRHIRLVLLSATIPNDTEMASWIAGIRVELVNIVRCDRRPIPLVHEVFRCGNPEEVPGRKRCFYKALTADGRFLNKNVERAVWQRQQHVNDTPVWLCPKNLIGLLIGRRGQNLKQLTEGLSVTTNIGENGEIQMHSANAAHKKEMQKRVAEWLVGEGVPKSQAWPPAGADPNDIAAEDLDRLLGILAHWKQLPAIGFCFNRNMCEKVAVILAGRKRMDFTNRNEKRQIHQKIREGIQNLSADDQSLKQIRNCSELLARGIGVHHAGMLPILRELVEILFKSGLLKVAFATETFSIGLNMPARSVIFMDVVKFDGSQRRVIDPGEFRQMSGRAGRRGIDDRGYVYVMLRNATINKIRGDQVLTDLYTGETPQVESHYHMRWASLLHLLCTGPAHVQFMVRRSFLVSTSPSAKDEILSTCTRMVNALQSLDYISSSGEALPKGIIASHLLVPDDAMFVCEVLIALRGFRVPRLSAPQVFAVCSCFIAEGPHDSNIRISDPQVRSCIRMCRERAQALADMLHSFDLRCCSSCQGARFCNGHDFIQARVQPKLVETALSWASGEDFTKAVLKSNIPSGGEGLVVRGLRRLDELMREISRILRYDLGAPVLAEEIRETRERVRRGVLVAQSMYLGEAEDFAGEEIEPDPPWPQPTLSIGEEGMIDPLDLAFSQLTCGPKFRDGTNRKNSASVLDLAKELFRGEVRVEKIEVLEIFWFRHRFYTLGNRRLAAFRLWRLAAGSNVMIPVKAVSRERALEREWLEKFTTGFTGGRHIRISGTNKYVGCTRQQSTYWEEEWPEITTLD